MKKILCFAPHPDDEILGCGGSLIKAIKLGYEIHICYLTFGEQGSPVFPTKKLKIIRKKESIKVSAFLGIPKSNIYFLGIPDNEINWHDIKAMKEIISLVRKIKPNIVYLPHEHENYYDHQQASLLIQRALGMAGSNNFKNQGKNSWWVENVLAYEVSTPMEKYQYAEDISGFIDQKIKVLKLYQSQTVKFGNASDFISDKAIFLPGYRAAMTIGEYREVFQVIRVAGIL